ncbi:unnamed protein product [Anisakis simplex]|uniref:Uncharacterized protein n=1 Tax=Anisakis simplex TaxID=6269 RepID=A0A0M3K0Y4_ANISI|nr:unnamed protein product [Anisakis simplex]
MTDVDEENPPLERKFFFGVSLLIRKSSFQLFKNPDPGFSTTVISVTTNFILSNMFVFGITGNWRAALLSGMLTIPVSSYSCIKDAADDFERWKETKALRLRGVPERFIPHRSKFDWTDYEAYMIDSNTGNRASSRS